MDDGGFIISTIGGNRVHLGSELMHLSIGELGRAGRSMAFPKKSKNTFFLNK